MRKLVVTIVGLGLLLAPAAASAAPRSIVGSTVDAATSAPVADLCVVASRQDGTAGGGSAKSASDGGFAIAGLAEGYYRLVATDCRANPEYGPTVATDVYVPTENDACCVQL